MKIYILTLPNADADRQRNVINLSIKLGRSVEIIQGIDAREAGWREQCPNWSGVLAGMDAQEQRKPGAVGCTQSHFNIWKKFLETDEECALVLEDDALLCMPVDHVAKAKDELLTLPNNGFDWAMAHTFGSDWVEWEGKDMGEMWREAKPCHTVSTVAYYISRDGAKKLLTQPPFTRPVDMMMQDLSRTSRCYQMRLESAVFNPSFELPSIIDMSSSANCQDDGIGCRVYQAEASVVYDDDYVKRTEHPTTARALSVLRMQMLDYSFPEAESVLDFGYGCGSFLKAAQQAGLKPLGFDVSGHLPDIPGFPVHKGAEGRRNNVLRFP